MNILKVSVLFLAIVSLSLFGCVGGQKSPFDGIADGVFTEAYIEFSGPNEKWAGPTSFLLYVNAKDQKDLEVKITPGALFRGAKDADLEVKNRVPASKAKGGISAQNVRERLTALADAIDSSEESFSGCLHPLRVRLVKIDGAVREWQGCRGSEGWSKDASQLTSELVAAARVL
jgi:hypothetical protein